MIARANRRAQYGVVADGWESASGGSWRMNDDGGCGGLLGDPPVAGVGGWMDGGGEVGWLS